jgi:hypothetical protein
MIILAPKLPDFVRKGTFTWTRQGYHYAEPPRINLLSDGALTSDDPWIQVAAVLERAKAGDNSQIPQLAKWLRQPREASLDRVSMLLTADAGTAEHLAALVDLMKDGTDDERMYACVAAADAGLLWLVPHMVEAWRRAVSLGDHETIGFAISDLLEERSTLDDMGLIAAAAGNYELEAGRAAGVTNPEKRKLGERVMTRAKGRNEAFEGLVHRRYEELVAAVGGDRVPVWAGKLYGVRSFAEHFYSLTRSPHQSTSLWGGASTILRRKLESATGLDCSRFFKRDVFQPLVAAAALETFLESPEAKAFEEGRRYFFGRQIAG